MILLYYYNLINLILETHTQFKVNFSQTWVKKILKILQQKFKELEIKTMLDGVPNSEGLRQKTVTAKKTVCEPVEVTQVNTTTADTAGIASTEWECMPLFHREEFSSALSVLPNFERQAWLKVGMSIHSMDHTQNGFELWDNWSKSCTDKYDSQTQAQVWFSFKTKRDKKRNKESVFYDARELDWKPDFEKTHY